MMTRSLCTGLFFVILTALAASAQDDRENDSLFRPVETLDEALERLTEISQLIPSENSQPSSDEEPRFVVTYDLLDIGKVIKDSAIENLGGDELTALQETFWKQTIPWYTLQNPHRGKPRMHQLDAEVVDAIESLKEIIEDQRDLESHTPTRGSTTASELRFCLEDGQIVTGSGSNANHTTNSKSVIVNAALTAKLSKLRKDFENIDLAIEEEVEDQFSRALEMYVWKLIANYFRYAPFEPAEDEEWLKKKFSPGTSSLKADVHQAEVDKFNSGTGSYPPKILWDTAKQNDQTDHGVLQDIAGFRFDQFLTTGIVAEIVNERQGLIDFFDFLEKSIEIAFTSFRAEIETKRTTSRTSSPPDCVPQLGGVWNKMRKNEQGELEPHAQNCSNRLVLSHGEMATNNPFTDVLGLIFEDTNDLDNLGKLSPVLAERIQQRIRLSVPKAAGCEGMVIFQIKGTLDSNVLSLVYAQDDLPLGRWIVDRDKARFVSTQLIQLKDGENEPDADSQRHARPRGPLCTLRAIKAKKDATPQELEALEQIKNSASAESCRK